MNVLRILKWVMVDLNKLASFLFSLFLVKERKRKNSTKWLWWCGGVVVWWWGWAE